VRRLSGQVVLPHRPLAIARPDLETSVLGRDEQASSVRPVGPLDVGQLDPVNPVLQPVRRLAEVVRSERPESGVPATNPEREVVLIRTRLLHRHLAALVPSIIRVARRSRWRLGPTTSALDSERRGVGPGQAVALATRRRVTHVRAGLQPSAGLRQEVDAVGPGAADAPGGERDQSQQHGGKQEWSCSEKAAETVVASIRSTGGNAEAVKADVSDPAAARSLFDAAEKAFGGADVVVNNAGIMTLATIATSDDAMFDRLIAVNLKGSFNMMREAATRLRRGGRIINFSSSVVGLLQPTYGIYAGTKAAIEAMTSVLAKELRGREITVNTIAPGPTATDLFLNGKSPELVERLAKLSPLERLGQPEDIAAAVAFLAGPDGAWINGQTLRANGGIV